MLDVKQIFGALVLSISILGGIYIIVNINNALINDQQNELRQQEAQYQHCLIIKPLEFPNASSTVIDRICELEKIGRAM